MTNPASIYVIGPDLGPQKVGISIVPAKRLRQLQGAHSQRLAIKHLVSADGLDPLEVEAYAHWLLRESRVMGEWFDVDADAARVAVVAAVEAVKSGLVVPVRIAGPGRPKLGTKGTNVRLSVDHFGRIAALVGPYGMSKFIREAIDNELDRREARERG